MKLFFKCDWKLRSIANTVFRILVRSIQNILLNTLRKKYSKSIRNTPNTTQVCNTDIFCDLVRK